MPDLPPDHVLRWAAQAVGAGATVEHVRRLRKDEGPWLLRLTHGRSTVDAILRTGPPEWHEIRTEAAALALAEEHGLPTPRLLAAQCNESRGYLAVLSAVLPGLTAIPRVATVERLRALGAATAALHAVPLAPRPDLPLRTHHMPWVDRSAERHWAREYHAAAEPDRSAVVTAWLREMPGPSHDEADAALREVRSTPLLDEADARLRAMNVPSDETVFVHGDLWHANTMWDGDSYVGMIDWEAAGAGHYGVDLGSLRWDAAILFGPSAPDQILAGWEEARGSAAADVAYWDLNAALNTDVDLSALVGVIHAEGRTDLDARTLTERRDAFVRTALDSLDAE
jgi:aminoglycoside phosphotransferase (APT) family kinase protein